MKVEAVFFIAGGVICAYPENVTTMLLQLLCYWLVGISEKPLFIGILQSRTFVGNLQKVLVFLLFYLFGEILYLSAFRKIGNTTRNIETQKCYYNVTTKMGKCLVVSELLPIFAADY